MEDLFRSIQEEAEKKANASREGQIPRIYIGKATCGLAAGALDTQKSFEDSLKEQGIEAMIRPVGCIGHCYAEPVVIIDHPESGFPPIFYPNVTPGKARMLVKSFLAGGDPLFEHMLGAMEENDLIPKVMDYPRFNLEERLVMERCGYIDPNEILEYIHGGGYSTLVKAFQLNPQEIIDKILASGLRGRGGP